MAASLQSSDKRFKSVIKKGFPLPWLIVILFQVSEAGQIQFGDFMRLERGMSEGEIIFRVGAPDKEIYFDGFGQRTAETIKQYLYIPRPEEPDPHVTIISYQRGRVIKIERIKMMSPSSTSSLPGTLRPEVFFKLETGMTEGEVLFKAGRPQKEVFLGDDPDGPNDLTKQYIYFPEPGDTDPHLTVLTFQNGRVIQIERTKILSN